LAECLKDEDDKNNLKITQRLRLDQSKLDDVTKRMSNASMHAVFLGIPTSSAMDHASDVQSR
jgi:RNA-binding protein 15